MPTRWTTPESQPVTETEARRRLAACYSLLLRLAARRRAQQAADTSPRDADNLTPFGTTTKPERSNELKN